jgi:hypothetical protein
MKRFIDKIVLFNNLFGFFLRIIRTFERRTLNRKSIAIYENTFEKRMKKT